MKKEQDTKEKISVKEQKPYFKWFLWLNYGKMKIKEIKDKRNVISWEKLNLPNAVGNSEECENVITIHVPMYI